MDPNRIDGRTLCSGFQFQLTAEVEIRVSIASIMLVENETQWVIV